MFAYQTERNGRIPHPADFAATMKAQMDGEAAAAAAEAAKKANANKPSAPGPATRPPHANTIRDCLVPSQLRLAAGGFPDIDGHTFREYRDALVREADSRDILEQTLLEQVALAHLSSFRLSAAAGMATTAEAAGIYAGAAAKVMGEVRRTIIAIKESRSPTPPPNITVATTQQVNVTGTTATDVSTETTRKTTARSGSKE